MIQTSSRTIRTDIIECHVVFASNSPQYPIFYPQGDDSNLFSSLSPIQILLNATFFSPPIHLNITYFTLRVTIQRCAPYSTPILRTNPKESRLSCGWHRQQGRAAWPSCEFWSPWSTWLFGYKHLHGFRKLLSLSVILFSFALKSHRIAWGQTSVQRREHLRSLWRWVPCDGPKPFSLFFSSSNCFFNQSSFSLD